jgi:hypothetical protein
MPALGQVFRERLAIDGNRDALLRLLNRNFCRISTDIRQRRHGSREHPTANGRKIHPLHDVTPFEEKSCASSIPADKRKAPSENGKA